MKKNNNYFAHFALLLHQQGHYLPELLLDFPSPLKSFLPMTHESTHVMNILEKIQLKLEHPSKSERKVADTILAFPKRIIHSSIATLAVEANVNEPAVSCSCRNVDARDFPDLKLHLVQSLTSDTSYVNRNVGEDDGIESYTGRIFESTMAGFDHVRQSLDNTAVNWTVDLLTQAKKIAFLGLGPSIVVAHDAMNKFLRSNVPVIYSDDVVLQRMSCANYSDDDVIVLTSHTGRTKSLVEPVQLARESDAMVIALTPPDTSLAHEVTLAITLDVLENIDIYTLMVSRLTQLTVIDVLVTGFTSRRGAKFRSNLKCAKEALKESCSDKGLLIRGDDR